MEEATPTTPSEPIETVTFEKRGPGRPKGSRDQIKRLPKGSLHPDKVQEGMLPPDVVARIRGGTGVIPIREKARLHAAAEKIRRDEAKKEASETALSIPAPEPIAVKPTEKQKLYARESIEKVIALAKVEGLEKTRLDALIDKAYLLAMDSSTDLEMLIKVIQMFADRLDGKAMLNVNHGEGGGGGGPLALTINVNATRFQVKSPASNEGVIDAE